MAQADPATQTVGFGKVLTSIHGLQRRLDDFSVDDVSEADTKAKTLIRQLSLLQEKLATLTELKEFVAAANRAIGEIPEEHFEQVDLDSLENHPKLHAIIQASKLIRFHRLMKAAKAGADSISFDAVAGTLRIAASPMPDHASGYTIGAAEVAPDERHAVSIDPTAAHDEPKLSEPAIASPSDQVSLPQEKQWEFSADVEPQTPHHGDTDRRTDGEFDGPQFPAQNEQTTDSQIQKHAAADDTVREQEKSSVAINTPFDRRLLSDLIEAYGEFLPSPTQGEPSNEPNALQSKLPAVEEAPVVVARSGDPVENGAPAEPQAGQLKPIEFAAVPALIEDPELEKPTPPAVRNVDLPAPRITPKPEKLTAAQTITLPANVEAVKPIEPGVAEAETERLEEKVPRVRKHGELDRQLKRIIKDYGEYDLYSHRSSGKFRTSVIAAFILLGLLLGGFYFFRAPTRSATPATPVPQSQTPSSANTNPKP